MVLHMGEHDVRIEISSGRSIVLRELDQWLVYEGLLGGEPTSDLNTKLITGILEASSAAGHRVTLIPPVEGPSSGNFDGSSDGERSDDKRRLAKVAVRARFESDVPVDGTGDYSELSVVWFQEAWALPIAPGVVAQITELDWAASARNMIW